ncbi:MAG: DUF924 domain-containing protein [Betaproteobacteria bacterium HGW-Betaproteobacteria-12]|nr:MAG: DUF924 domain-containing protein [Betaproteobacteria bacterium HGW-Betaproteobacteria-12]
MGDGLAAEILAFWFGQPGEAGHGQPRSEWFRKDAAFDAEIRRRFLPDVESALAGQLDAWAATLSGLLALLILLDQFPRNLFRGQARAFAGDAAARRLAETALSRGWDRKLNAVEKLFVYLPFEHSEALADQERSLALFAALAAEHPGNDGFLDYARRHHAVIARFGRFPHRNTALGRPSSPEEASYLAEPGSGF